MLDERVPSDLKKNLMQARLDKKMTQAQLAQVLCGIIKFQNFNSSILSWEVAWSLFGRLMRWGYGVYCRWSMRSHRWSRSMSRARQSPTSRSLASSRGPWERSCVARNSVRTWVMCPRSSIGKTRQTVCLLLSMFGISSHADCFCWYKSE